MNKDEVSGLLISLSLTQVILLFGFIHIRNVYSADITGLLTFFAVLSFLLVGLIKEATK